MNEGWIDINLTVTPTTVPLLFNLLSDSALPIRLAACDALSRIVAKGLKEPLDKLQLIKVLSLGQVLDALETRTRAEHASRGSDIDEGEESYRESLGKLLNVLGVELSKLLDVCIAAVSLHGRSNEHPRSAQSRRALMLAAYCIKFFPSCFVSWATSMTTPVKRSSLCFA